MSSLTSSVAQTQCAEVSTFSEQLRQQEFILASVTTAVTHLLGTPLVGVVIAQQGQLYVVYKDAANMLLISPVTDNQQLIPGSKVTINVVTNDEEALEQLEKPETQYQPVSEEAEYAEVRRDRGEI